VAMGLAIVLGRRGGHASIVALAAGGTVLGAGS
jgi:hypothetical protein